MTTASISLHPQHRDWPSHSCQSASTSFHCLYDRLHINALSVLRQRPAILKEGGILSGAVQNMQCPRDALALQTVHCHVFMK